MIHALCAGFTRSHRRLGVPQPLPRKPLGNRDNRQMVSAMSIYLVLAWGFVAFTALLVLGVLWLWWLEHTEQD